jgi:hypothetical protein
VETSVTRRVLIVAMTYAGGAVFLARLDPFVNAIVPVIGFTLSTLSLSFFKEKWIQSNSKK